ncbi:MAG: dipeptidase PepV [Lachnospiraceae bacterium]|nr:dipeptidase PepV [Lachnospiraceae bacterium]
MYREQLEQYIDAHKEEMLADIIELCKIDSAKGPYVEGKPFGEGPFKALAKGLEIGEKHGFAITNYDNYVGTIDLNDKEKQLDILAHLDIVPGGEGWTVTTPFEPVIKDGKLYGRGTSDDKGPAMTALYAMKAIKELGIPVKKNVRLILGTDEECGSSDIRYYYKKEKEAPMSFSPDAEFPVINLEKGSIHGEFNAEFEKCEALPKMVAFKSGVKSNVVPPKAYALFEGLDGSETEAFAKQFEAELGVTFDVTSENGYLKLEAIGESAHASTPEKGTNALTALMALIEKMDLADCGQMKLVKALNKMMPHGDNHGAGLGVNHEDEISGKLTLAFTMLDVTETGLKGDFDSRCPICANKENTFDVIKKQMIDSGLNFTTEKMSPSHYVDGNSPFVQTLLKCYEQYTGRKGECIAIGGGTYVHHLENGVAFGPSMPETETGIHGPDEFAVIDELVTATKIFAQVIVDLCC